MSRSVCPFCHGDRAAVGRSRMPHRTKPLEEGIAIDAIPITNDISWRRLPAVCLRQLSGNPLSARMCGHAKQQNITARVPAGSRIHTPGGMRSSGPRTSQSTQYFGMVVKKGLPSLRWRSSWSYHVLATVVCPTSMPSMRSSAVDPWCSPKPVRDTHFANELTNLHWSLRSATLPSRLPPPIGSEASAVPRITVSGLRIFSDVQDARSQPIHPHKHQPVDALDGHSLRQAAPQHVESRRRTRISASSRALDQISKSAHCEQSEKVDHRTNIARNSGQLASRMRFPVGTKRDKYLPFCCGFNFLAWVLETLASAAPHA